jgi:predicted DNA-binding protein (MmcQ/YjbR family)
MTRQNLFDWVRKEYGTESEYPWHDRNAVLRRKDNGKWYGVVLEVSGDKLGLPEKDFVDVLNVKSDPMLIASLWGQTGYFPAYHMNKEKWISVLLGQADLDDPIRNLLALSYELTAPKRKKSQAGGI